MTTFTILVIILPDILSTYIYTYSFIKIHVHVVLYHQFCFSDYIGSIYFDLWNNMTLKHTHHCTFIIYRSECVHTCIHMHTCVCFCYFLHLKVYNTTNFRSPNWASESTITICQGIDWGMSMVLDAFLLHCHPPFLHYDPIWNEIKSIFRNKVFYGNNSL
jgi:hypothetical protein